LSRGRERVVLGSSSSVVGRRVDVLVDVSLLDVVDVGSPGLMSLVTGGLVLVMVWVVVLDVDDDVRYAELEPPGSR